MKNNLNRKKFVSFRFEVSVQRKQSADLPLLNTPTTSYNRVCQTGPIVGWLNRLIKIFDQHQHIYIYIWFIVIADIFLHYIIYLFYSHSINSFNQLTNILY